MKCVTFCAWSKWKTPIKQQVELERRKEKDVKFSDSCARYHRVVSGSPHIHLSLVLLSRYHSVRVHFGSPKSRQQQVPPAIARGTTVQKTMTKNITVAGRVSIVIPAYNCGHTIPATIRTCLEQDYPDVEIIVVNDGSTDDTIRALGEFASRVRILEKTNEGVAAARNFGTRAATGEFIAWMDHDDLMLPTRISLQAEVLRADPTLWLVSSDFSAFRDEANDFERSHIASYYSAVRRLGGIECLYSAVRELEFAGERIAIRSGDIYEHLISGNFVHPPTVMVRRSAFERAGYFDESLAYNSEYDLVFRIARLGPVAFVDSPLLRYRRSETQLSHGTAGGKIPLETVRVLERVQREDPETYHRNQKLFQRRLAVQYIDVADLIGPADRLRALKMLARGVMHAFLPRPALRALARIVTPRFVVRAIKHRWKVALAVLSATWHSLIQDGYLSALELQGSLLQTASFT